MSILPPNEIAAAKAAVGRREVRTMVLDAESLRRFSQVIGGDGDVDARFPVLGHWAWFLPCLADEEIGDDGHPVRGVFLPALPSLPRRMFASAVIDFEAPLQLGNLAEMITAIVDVQHKSGRSGDLVFVEVERRIAQGGIVCIVERQTLVYRAAGGSVPLPLPQGVEDVALAAGNQLWTPGAVNLFRFSAVTFNAHRIHYDETYARQVEGYPALIVHGPFIACKLAELAGRDGALSRFEFRAQLPCFVDQPIGMARVHRGEFQAIRCDGAVATLARAAY